MDRNILLILEFDGTDFFGWQYQPGQRTVQGVLEETLRKMLNEKIKVRGSGRTDAGVHALGMPANFRTRHSIPTEGLVKGLNSLLPRDIRAISARDVPYEFCARRWARGKRYRYQIWNAPQPSALERNRSWWIPEPLDVEAMNRASRALLGRHDFSAFRASGCSANHPIRELREIAIYREGPKVILEFEGTAFLRHMVRNLVGSLIEVGKKNRPEEWIARVLESKNRKEAGVTAPPQGLYLLYVNYQFPEEN